METAAAYNVCSGLNVPQHCFRRTAEAQGQTPATFPPFPHPPDGCFVPHPLSLSHHSSTSRRHTNPQLTTLVVIKRPPPPFRGHTTARGNAGACSALQSATCAQRGFGRRAITGEGGRTEFGAGLGGREGAARVFWGGGPREGERWVGGLGMGVWAGDGCVVWVVEMGGRLGR